MTLTKKLLMIALFLGILGMIAISSHFTTQQAEPVPMTPVSTLPDFNQYADVKKKKAAFFEYLLPHIQKANSEILLERQTAKAMDITQLSKAQHTQLKALMDKYRVKDNEITAGSQQKLLNKIDIIPPSLALAQAANESSWGTSRFATQAFNFYGQWCFTKGCGLVPKNRSAGLKHEVRKFKSPYESVKGYMHNLNSHPAFKKVRQQRSQARLQNATPTGLTLAKGLINYSERKEDYIEEISAMIRHNKLAYLD